MELSQETRHSSTASTISTIPEETGAVEPEDFPQIYNDQIDNEPDISCSRTIASASHQREPSETAYFLSHGDTGSSPKEKRGHAAETQTVQGQTGKSTWRPLTLRPPYLSFLFILSLFLGILTLILTVVSSRNYGLGNDDGSSILLFGWRFSPTLVATIYGILVASLLNDVRRTEIFARLSGPDGASAKDTLCFPSRAWLNDPVDALNKETRSWTLFFTSTLYILTLVASPLSAGLFSPTDTQIPLEVIFHKANIEGLTWPQDTEDSIMFRTISGAVLNQSTSAWLTKSSAILPFWPSYSASAPLGPIFSTNLHPEKWQVRTTAYQIDLDCDPIPLARNYNATYTWTEMQPGYSGNGTIVPAPVEISRNYTFLELQSQDGCQITLADSGIDWMLYGGGWWAGPPLYNTSLLRGMSNSSSACGDRTMFFINSGRSGSETFQLQAQICSDEFYSAEVLATVSLNQSSTVVTFDSSEDVQEWEPLDRTVFNVTQLREAFLSSDWSSHFLRFNEDAPIFAGPLMSIAASNKYNNDPMKLLADSNLQQELTTIYQQFFGETLLAALENNAEESAETVPGQLTVFERRIMASPGIGIALATTLLCSSGCIAFVAYASGHGKRDLNLTQDPGTISAATSLIKNNQNVRKIFQLTDQSSQQALTRTIGKYNFSIAYGNIPLDDKGEVTNHDDVTPKDSIDSKKDPRPVTLHAWIGALLLLFLVALIVTIAVLYTTSRTTGIHQSPFVYQMKMSILNSTTTLAPYSILPTLLALGVKLWFGAIGDTLKLLQPYVSMVKAPVPVTTSVLAEYVNTPIVMISVKAWRNSHLILAFVGFGALAAETFTVAMSALWNKEIGTLSHPVNVTRHLELRTIPQLFQRSQGIQHNPYKDLDRTVALASIYQSSLQSWFYGAAIELSQSGSTPAWSKDTWSFAPLDVEELESAASSLGSDMTSIPGYVRNVTFRTYGLRARLECHTIDFPPNNSAWFTTVDFTNRTINPDTNQSTWNATNSPPGLDYGYALTGMAGSGPRFGYFTCCANETEDIPGNAAIGYWTNLLWTPGYSEGESHWGDLQMSMTAKFILGRPLDKLYQPNSRLYTPPLLVWIERPRMLLVNCTPFIEHANATVVAELDTGVVQSYDILEPPLTATEAWLDYYLPHNTSVDYTHHWTTLADGVWTNVTSYYNMTTSWGYVFWNALLNSGRASEFVANDNLQFRTDPEDLSDRSFNFRDIGLNADFMTYSMLALANNSREALLDPKTFIELANQTFGVFFKHFVSDNVTSAHGGNAYQPIGQKLPWSLGPVLDPAGTRIADDQGALGIENKTTSAAPFVSATIQIPVEQLVMSPIAVFLCLSLLVFLVLVTIVMYTANHDHYKQLPRNVDTLASTLAYVHGSEKLLAWTATAPRTKPWYKALFSTDSSLEVMKARARLGPFTDSKGVERWGIELVDIPDHGHHPDDASAIELLELHPREEHNNEDNNGDIASQASLLGNFEWEARTNSARHSDLTLNELHETVYASGEEERDLLRGIRDN